MTPYAFIPRPKTLKCLGCFDWSPLAFLCDTSNLAAILLKHRWMQPSMAEDRKR